MSDNLNKKKIIKNSVLLYVRMLFTMWINLYTTRLVLANLGVNDMGIYGVVGSIVSIFSIFTGGVTNTVQRFITYELGREKGEINKVFCSCLNLIILLSIVILVLLETIGLWFLYNKINIPPSRIGDTFLVFQFSVIACIINMLSIPYNALIIAHEKMDVFALISVIQVILSCGVAYCLSYIGGDCLVSYAALMALVSLLIRIMYQLYCHFKFKESHYNLIIDKLSLKQIGNFAGIATMSGILEAIYNQGVVFIINWNFGVALNAVYGIALQLKNSVLSFSFNIFKAISPQITKTYANGDFVSHCKLVYSGSKMEIYMIYLIMMPFLCRAEYIIKLWLGEVPENMVIFSKVIIFVSLIYALFEPIRSSVLASNKISKFMLIPNIYNIAFLIPCYYLSFLFNYPLVLLLSILVIEVLICFIRIYYALKVTPLTLKPIMAGVVFPTILVAVINSIFCYYTSLVLPDNLLGLIILLFVNTIALSILIYFIGINRVERIIVNKMIGMIFSKISLGVFAKK